MMTDLKAYLLHSDYGYDDEQDHEIIFAKQSIVAKRQWSCNHWDGHEIAGIASKRVPEFDQYAPGPVPELVLVDHGWWVECSGCLQRISEDTIHDENLKPIAVKVDAWCSQKCYDNEMLERKKIKRMEAAGIRIMAARLRRKIPQAHVIFDGEKYRTAPHVYVQRNNQGRLAFQQIVLRFSWPHQRIGHATYRMNKRREMPGIYVANGDKERFNEWLVAAGVKI